jgi:F-type H+-transporting ATPase subunit b
MMNLFTTFAAGAAAAGEKAEETSEGIGALGLSLPAIIASAITFTLLYIVVKKYALSGIVSNLEKREKDINRGLHLTAEMDKKSAELEATVEAELKKARKEADLIIAESRAETGKMIQEAEEKAKHQAGEILRAAEGKIEREITEARNGLKKEMAGLITEATEAILGQKLDATGDRKLVETYLKEAMK